MGNRTIVGWLGNESLRQLEDQMDVTLQIPVAVQLV
jgi:hypothetical protein